TSADVVDGVFIYEIGIGAYVVGVFGGFMYLLAIINILIKVHAKEIPFQRVRLVVVGLTLVMVGAVLNLNTSLGTLGIDIIFNAINAFLVTYSIYRNKFLEINLVVKKGLSFSLYYIVLYFIYISMALLAFQILYVNLEITNFTTIIIMISPLFILLEPIRRMIQRGTNHIFYRHSTDRQVILKDFSNLISSELKLDMITESLIEALQAAVDSKEVTIFLKNAVKYKLHKSSIKDIVFEDTFIMFDHPIVNWFSSKNESLFINQINSHPIFKGLWDKEKAVIESISTEIIIPIKYLDELIGLVVVSERNDQTPYSEVETDFIKTIVNNGAAIIENAKTYELIKRQSITDELTKLYTHRYFYEVATNWIDSNVHSTFSLAMLDVDQFKIYNDLYGHSAGDVALKRIAEIINNNTRDEDVLIRYGGEEFIILFPNIDGNESLKAIDLIRRGIEEEFLLSKDIREFLTVSIGVSNYPSHTIRLEELIEYADRAMYSGKSSGRNKAVLFDPDTESINNTEQNKVEATIREAYLSSIYALAATIDAKDHYTFGHSNNVAKLARELARKAKFSDKDVEIIYSAGLLHDIGKVGIPESILSKPGKLTQSERDLMNTHVIQSINIIKHIPNLLDTVPAIMSHHEQYDGNGYPRGISGKNIPILGRCICIADSFDAMTTNRPYKQGLTFDEAIDELKRHRGKQFDPELVDIFVELMDRDVIDQLNLENRIV
ncbi:MAG: diguanylate cyclase, partial [Candidatus Izemoplasma sp.]